MTDPMGRQTQFTYDSAGRVTSVQHRVHSTGALIIGYAVTYDAASRVTRINESPTNAVTTYQYDSAGRLLREERTVNRPYLGEYQYDASGNRTYARRVENGVETHRGTYTYDGAGRLIRVVDAATGVTENYVWNADGTLASFPGPGYTRLLEYDEEGRLIRIRRDYGNGNVQLAYEYAYGFDGGRRWRKDYLNGVWTRYPCGVACGAGDLVEQQKPLEGGSWTTTALYLQGISLVRRNSEWHHFDPLGTAGVITNSSASVISNNLYDAFGVLRYQQGSAETPVVRRLLHKGEDEISWLATRGVLTHRLLFINKHLHPLSGGGVPSVGGEDDRQKYCNDIYETCMSMAKSQHKSCVELCTVSFLTCASLCFFADPLAPECQLGCLTVYGVCRMGCAILKLEKERECERIYWDCIRGKPGIVPVPPSAPPALQ